PEKHLKEHGIDVNVDLPGVGQNLQDHSCVILQYACKKWEQGNYRKEMKEGLWTKWDENGQIIAQENFKDGKLV
ncbi:GMC family oxidoreductase N-terminal domain-containing protein, partial [Candidatus Pseudothioglobus singularis]|nr:GMC family oxidoreductase N-terminal domain-containing protein [Candidatus Pseudothioglobus singularis]